MKRKQLNCFRSQHEIKHIASKCQRIERPCYGWCKNKTQYFLFQLVNLPFIDSHDCPKVAKYRTCSLYISMI